MKSSYLIAVPMHPIHESIIYHNGGAGFFLVFPCFSKARRSRLLLNAIPDVIKEFETHFNAWRFPCGNGISKTTFPRKRFRRSKVVAFHQFHREVTRFANCNHVFLVDRSDGFRHFSFDYRISFRRRWLPSFFLFLTVIQVTLGEISLASL